MILRRLKYAVLLVMLLHFLGATQWLNVYANNTSALFSLISAVEEESKKENDTNSGTEEYIATKNRSHVNNVLRLSCSSVFSALSAPDAIVHQHIAEQLTPPPNTLT